MVFFFVIPEANIYSESYPEYRTDDLLYISLDTYRFQNLPRVELDKSPESKRPEKSYSPDSPDANSSQDFVSNPPLQPPGSDSWNQRFFVTGRHRTQRGGDSEESGGRNRQFGILSGELEYRRKISGWTLGFILSGTGLGIREERFRVEEDFSADFESILSLSYRPEFASFFRYFFLQAGRGFQRLDRFGWFFQDNMNFLQAGAGFRFKDSDLGLQVIGGRPRPIHADQGFPTSTPLESLWGVRLFFDSNRSFYPSSEIYMYSNIREKVQPNQMETFRPGMFFRTIGSDLSTGFLFAPLSLEFGGLVQEQIQDRFLDFEFQWDSKNKEIVKKYYGRLSWKSKLENHTFRLGGLVRENGPFYSWGSDPRVFGGDGSILLGFRNQEFGFREGKGPFQLSGFSYHFKLNFLGLGEDRLSVFLQSSREGSEIGREAILQLGSKFSSTLSGFGVVSFAWGEIRSQTREAILRDEIRNLPPAGEFFKVFLSMGMYLD